MYDVDDKLLNGIKSIYVKFLSCVGVQESDSDSFRIESGVRRGWLLLFT